ncbi:MAG: hypothetical protein HY332_10650 [Chloroflexi bacterium]|nr:hypothetical protein [Chloroflexota bacterium]
MVRCADPEYPTFDPYLPRAFFVFAADRAAGRLSVLVERRGRGTVWLCDRQSGDHVRVFGPAGRGVRLARLTRHLLLLADGPIAVAGLALLASESARRGASVTLVENIAAGGGVPPHLLHPDIEYRGTSPEAGGLLGELPGLLPWADEVVIAAPESLLETVSSLRRARHEPFTLYGNVPIQALPLACTSATSTTSTLAETGSSDRRGGGDYLPCGTGTCGACVVATRSGEHLFCREGPAFPLEALRFEHVADEEDVDAADGDRVD